MRRSTITTLDPVVSSAIAATRCPSTPVSASTRRVASTSASIWSLCRCVANSGSSRRRRSGYSADAVPSRPRSLSSSVTRTLSVPKSTPAAIMFLDPGCGAHAALTGSLVV